MSRHISLENLEAMTPGGVHSSQAGLMRSSCTAAMLVQRHSSDVLMYTTFPDESCDVAVRWSDGVTEDDLRYFVDVPKRVDFAACAIALLIIPEMTGYQAVAPSSLGTGFDYYMARDGTDPDLPYNDTRVLEVSGLQSAASPSLVAQRIRDKVKRFRKFRPTWPPEVRDVEAFVCVVEFSRPSVTAVVV